MKKLLTGSLLVMAVVAVATTSSFAVRGTRTMMMAPTPQPTAAAMPIARTAVPAAPTGVMAELKRADKAEIASYNCAKLKQLVATGRMLDTQEPTTPENITFANSLITSKGCQ